MHTTIALLFVATVAVVVTLIIVGARKKAAEKRAKKVEHWQLSKCKWPDAPDPFAPQPGERYESAITATTPAQEVERRESATLLRFDGSLLMQPGFTGFQWRDGDRKSQLLWVRNSNLRFFDRNIGPGLADSLYSDLQHNVTQFDSDSSTPQQDSTDKSAN